MTFNAPPHVLDILNSEGCLIVLGSGRSGKTLLGHLIASKASKPVVCLGYPQTAIDECPPGWTSCEPIDVFSLRDCVLIIDDAALFASSRDFSNKWSKKWVQFQTIISHKNITLLFIVQSSNLLDIGTLRSQRMAVLYKYSDETNVLYERDEFRRVAMVTRQVIGRLRQQFPNVHPKAWVFDMTLGKAWHHSIPSHWTPTLSIPYRDYIITMEELV